MRSLTFASVFAFALSAWSVTSATLDKGYDQLETIETISDKYPSNTLEKRYRTFDTAYFGYVCKTKFFGKKKIEETRKRACEKLKSRSRPSLTFPAVYEPKESKAKFLEVYGIKYIFPLRRKGFFPEKNPGNYRIVLNSSCRLAGVVKVKQNTSGRVKKNQFQKCDKVFK